MKNPKLKIKTKNKKLFSIESLILTAIKSQRNNKSLIHDANDFNDGYAAPAHIAGT